MLPVKLPEEDAVSLVLSASFGRLELAVGTAVAGYRPVAVDGTIGGLRFHTNKNVKDAEIASVLAPSLITGFSKLADSAPKDEHDLFVDMHYKSKGHDIHETFTIPIRQDKLKQFMTLAAKLIQMQGKR